MGDGIVVLLARLEGDQAVEALAITQLQRADPGKREAGFRQGPVFEHHGLEGVGHHLHIVRPEQHGVDDLPTGLDAAACGAILQIGLGDHTQLFLGAIGTRVIGVLARAPGVGVADAVVVVQRERCIEAGAGGEAMQHAGPEQQAAADSPHIVVGRRPCRARILVFPFPEECIGAQPTVHKRLRQHRGQRVGIARTLQELQLHVVGEATIGGLQGHCVRADVHQGQKRGNVCESHICYPEPQSASMVNRSLHVAKCTNFQ
jgi:hypothetical protein